MKQIMLLYAKIRSTMQQMKNFPGLIIVNAISLTI